MIKIILEKTITFEQNDVYILHHRGKDLIINKNYAGLILLTNELTYKKEVNFPSFDIIINNVFSHQDWIALDCEEDKAVRVINLFSDSLFELSCFFDLTPLYCGIKDSFILFTWDQQFINLDCKRQLIEAMDVSLVKKYYSSFFTLCSSFKRYNAFSVDLVQRMLFFKKDNELWSFYEGQELFLGFFLDDTVQIIILGTTPILLTEEKLYIFSHEKPLLLLTAPAHKLYHKITRINDKYFVLLSYNIANQKQSTLDLYSLETA